MYLLALSLVLDISTFHCFYLCPESSQKAWELGGVTPVIDNSRESPSLQPLMWDQNNRMGFNGDKCDVSI